MRIVDDLPEVTSNSKYNWGMLFDGQARELIRGEDFECNVSSMQVHAMHVAKNAD